MKNFLCEIKRITVALLSFVFAGSFLCSCSTVKTTEPETLENDPVIEEIAETVSEPEDVSKEV